MRGEKPTTNPFQARQRTPEQDNADQAFGQGTNPAPTKAPLAPRSSSPAAYATSGMERALGSLADRVHKPKPR